MTFLRIFIKMFVVSVMVIGPSALSHNNQYVIVRGQQSPKAPKREPTFIERLLRVFGITASSSTQKGEPDDLTGDIRVADLKEGGNFGVTTDGGYSWPIFLPCDQSIVALRQGKVVKISMPGTAQQTMSVIATNPQIVKLVGYSLDNSNEILVLRKSAAKGYSVGLLSSTTGQITNIPFNESTAKGDPVPGSADERMLDAIKGSQRLYGTTIVYVESQSKPTQANKSLVWKDVLVQESGHNPINVSLCDGTRCGQPSLSPEGRYVVFIKQAP